MQRLLLAVALSAATAQAQKHVGPSPNAKPPAAEYPTPKAGVTTRVFHPTATRNWRGATAKELDCTVWYPAVDTAVETRQFIGPPDEPLFEAGMASPHAPFAPSLEALPLVLLSHGTAGSAEQMAWLGTALARAGYIAVAVNHPGNNGTEAYTAEGFVLWWERATDLSEVLDGMLADPDLGPRIDAKRVAAAGFSIGGYTAMELGGAETDVSVMYDLCRTDKQRTAMNAEMDARFVDANSAVCHVPEYKGVGTPQTMLEATRKSSGASLARAAESFRDARVKAVFAIEPAVEFVLTHDSLRAMRVPVEVVVGTEDKIAPGRDNADYVRAFVRGAREMTLPGVRHYTFLDACTAAGKAKLGVLCEDEPGVERDAIHAQVAAEAVKFFNHALKWR